MARTKARWIATYAGHCFLDGRSVIVPLRVDIDPARVVELRIPLSSLDRFLNGVQRAAEFEPAEEEEEFEQTEEEPEPEGVEEILPQPSSRKGYGYVRTTTLRRPSRSVDRASNRGKHYRQTI